MSSKAHKIIGLVGALLLSAVTVLLPSGVAAQDEIKIGDLDSYNRWAAFAVPYRNGWQVALGEINAHGGVLGKRLVVVSRDDGGTPTDAIRAADELVSREGVTVLMGTFLSNVSLAVADYAKQRHVVFVPVTSASDAITLRPRRVKNSSFVIGRTGAPGTTARVSPSSP